VNVSLPAPTAGIGTVNLTLSIAGTLSNVLTVMQDSPGSLKIRIQGESSEGGYGSLDRSHRPWASAPVHHTAAYLRLRYDFDLTASALTA